MKFTFQVILSLHYSASRIPLYLRTPWSFVLCSLSLEASIHPGGIVPGLCVSLCYIFLILQGSNVLCKGFKIYTLFLIALSSNKHFFLSILSLTFLLITCARTKYSIISSYSQLCGRLQFA